MLGEQLKLPVYGLRKYEQIAWEGDYLVVSSFYNKYVLDDRSLSGSFGERRLKLTLKKDELPYKIYPLKIQLKYLSHFARSKSKVFIDSDGKIFNRKKSKFYTVEVKKVINSSQIYNGKYQCYVRGIPFPFILTVVPEWVSVIKYKNGYILYDIHEEEPESPRLRVKI